MKKIILLAFVAFVSRVNASAQDIELVADINTDGSQNWQFSSTPQNFKEYKGKLYFSAKGVKTGKELFSYDGTEVTLVADINSSQSGYNYVNSDPYGLAVMKNKLYFAANNGDSTCMYSYDATSPPVLEFGIKNPYNITNSQNPSFFVFNNKLLYQTRDFSTRTYKLWEYDGSSAPTELLSVSGNSYYGFQGFVIYNNKLYFNQRGSQSFWRAYYVYDGVNPPTKAPHSSSFGSLEEEAIVFNNKIYFSNFSSGTAAGELYSYDGVNAPVLIHDIAPGSISSNPKSFVVYNNKLMFTANDGSHGEELWEYDGTNTPSMVVDINTVSNTYIGNLTVYKNKLHFSAIGNSGHGEIYEYDGTNTPKIAKELNSKSTNTLPYSLTPFNNNLLFGATDGTLGTELYKYDGTTISLAADIFNSTNASNPNHITAFKDKMYFSAIGPEGNELYSYNGTSVELVADLDTGHRGTFGAASGSNPNNFFEFNNHLYFSASDSQYRVKRWKFDGINLPVEEPSLPAYGSFIEFNNKLYFADNKDTLIGRELYVYDGATTTLAFDLNPGKENSHPYAFAVINGKLIFNAQNASSGAEMWEYDGTSAPTMIADIHTGTRSSDPQEFTSFNGKIYFTAEGDTLTGYEVWEYDGTNAPTLVADIFPGKNGGYANSSYPYYFNVLNNKLFFSARDGVNGQSLWEYDGTNTPTIFATFSRLDMSQGIRDITKIGDAIYYWADEGKGLGAELYKYDGTGTPHMYNELYVGPVGSAPNNGLNIAEYDGHIYFGARDGVVGYYNGSELYRIQGCGIDNSVAVNGNTLEVSEANASYQWVDCDDNNAPIAGETNQSFTATTSGNYACIIETTDCQKTTICENIQLSSIKEKASIIDVYPNPVSDNLYLVTDKRVNSIQVFSAQGRLVSELIGNTAEISVKDLPVGIYTLRVEYNNSFGYAKFIKR